MLNDNVICSERHDDDDYNDDDDDDGVPPPILYECHSYFKRITDFTLAHNNSELLADKAKWQKML